MLDRKREYGQRERRCDWVTEKTSDLVVDREMELGEKCSDALDEGETNIEEDEWRIVELGQTDETDGVRLCRASEGSTQCRCVVQLQCISRGSDWWREQKVE